VSDFGKLWAGQTISLLGSALTLFALPSLAVLTLHATTFQLGALAALETLPFPLLGLLVGVLADRVSRRAIMITADALAFVALASVPPAAAFHVLHLPQLYAIALLTGIASVFFGISYQSYLPVLVERERLPSANSKLEISSSGAKIIGSGVAGILVQSIGAAAAIGIDAFSYVASIVTLARIRTAERRHEGPRLSLRQAAREIGEGLTLVFRSPDLRWILGATASTNLGSAMVNAVILIYAYRLLHVQPGPLGVVFGLAELGFVGALLSVRVRNVLGLRATLVLALLASAIAEGGLLLASVAPAYAVFF
jgi:MFS family permease